MDPTVRIISSMIALVLVPSKEAVGAVVAVVVADIAAVAAVAAVVAEH